MTFRSGDLVRIKNEAGMPPDMPVRTQRLLLLAPNEDLTAHKAWVGPVDMSPREVDEFKEEFLAGMPHQQKYANCFSVDIAQLGKLADA